MSLPGVSMQAALLSLALVAAALPAPAEPSSTILLPAGHVLRLDAAGKLSVLPAGAPPGLPHRLEAKQCHNDLPRGYLGASQGIASNADHPLESNDASAGECPTQTHQGPVTYLEFSTRGDYYGGFGLYGADAATRRGVYSVWCRPVGAGVGVPGPTSWTTGFSGRDFECIIRAEGTQPHEWVEWHGVVVNYHTAEGSTSDFLAF